MTQQIFGQVAPQVPDKYPPSTLQVLSALRSPGKSLPRRVLQKAAGLRNREYFVNEHLQPLLAAGLLERTVPEKPRSSKQKYRLTEKGRQALRERKGGNRGFTNSPNQKSEGVENELRP